MQRALPVLPAPQGLPAQPAQRVPPVPVKALPVLRGPPARPAPLGRQELQAQPALQGLPVLPDLLVLPAPPEPQGLQV